MIMIQGILLLIFDIDLDGIDDLDYSTLFKRFDPIIEIKRIKIKSVILTIIIYAIGKLG